MDLNTGGFLHRNGFAVCLFITSILCIPLAAQNGITANESGTITGAANVDALWADSTDHRWKMNNDANSGSTGVDVAIWACPTQLGGIVYAGTAVSGIDTENCLSLAGTAGIPLLAGSSAPQWGGNSTVSLDLQNWAVVGEVLNETVTGTIVNTLAKITSTSTTGAIQAGTGDSFVPTFVVLAGAGKTGNAQLALSGQANCKMDATNGSGVEGQPVFASTSTAGDCSTATLANVPVGAWIVGQMISNSTTAGSTSLILVQPGYRTVGTSTTNNYAAGATLTLAATNTTASAATTISNANSTNNNASNALLVKTTGTSTGSVPLVVDQSGTSSTGDIADFQRNDSTLVSINNGGFIVSASTVRLAADQTFNTDTSLHNINNLTWTLPSTPNTQAYSIHCAGNYAQATAAAANPWGIQVATAVNNWTANFVVFKGANSVGAGGLVGQTATTATTVATITPAGGGATILPWQMDGTIENKANQTVVVNIMVGTGNTSDTVTVYRGSYCTITP